MFTENQRGGFKYWFAHWSAYQMTALNLNCWKFKYLFHDIKKPWLMIYAKAFHRNDPYKWVQHYHRTHSNHHLQHCVELNASQYDNDNIRTNTPTIVGLDVEAMLIDWECSRFTKAAQPHNAFEYYESIKTKLSPILQVEIEATLNKMGLLQKVKGFKD